MTATSPVIAEHYYTGGFIVSEAEGLRSRDVGTFLNAGTADLQLEAGTVISPKVGTIAIAGAGTNGATGVPQTIAIGANYTPGAFTLTARNSGTFDVADPLGNALPAAATGAAYADAKIKWSGFANGTGTFVAGDAITLTVPAPSGTYEPSTSVNLPAVGVLFNRVFVPASGSKKATVILRDAEVNQSELQWDTSILNAGTFAAGQPAKAIGQLGSHDIIAR